jgi:hypothetical protein
MVGFLSAAHSRWSSLATGSFVLEFGDLHEAVGKGRGPHPELKALASLGEAALHTTTAEQPGGAPLQILINLFFCGRNTCTCRLGVIGEP